MDPDPHHQVCVRVYAWDSLVEDHGDRSIGPDDHQEFDFIRCFSTSPEELGVYRPGGESPGLSLPRDPHPELLSITIVHGPLGLRRSVPGVKLLVPLCVRLTSQRDFTTTNGDKGSGRGERRKIG